MWEYFFEIMAHLSEAATVQRSLTIANSVTSFLERNLIRHSPFYEFLLPDFQVHTLSLNTSIAAPLTFSNNFTLAFDESFLAEHEGATLRIAFIHYNMFLGVTPQGNRTVAPLALINLDMDG